MNPFLIPGVEIADGPRDFYAFVDQLEPSYPSRDEPRTVRLDCVGRQWFAQFREYNFPLAMLREAPLAIIEAEIPSQADAKKNGTPNFEENQWLSLSFGSSDGLAAALYRNLYAGAADGAIRDIEPVPEEVQQQLQRAFSLRDLADASIDDLQKLLSVVEVDFISVLDVGQGNFNGLWRDQGGAQLYFDAGGGIGQHNPSFPASLTVCSSCQPPIVLSHWDHDHWSSGPRFPALQDCVWIAPDQGVMGASHTAFAAGLQTNHQLRVWPRHLGILNAGQLTIERCTGTDRNNNGLAMLVGPPRGAAGNAPVLLTGDADYASIPSVASKHYGRYHAVVVPHHGGRASSTAATAQPVSGRMQRLVYSYASPNHYGHPHFSTLQQHRSCGWRANETRFTPSHHGTRPQHVGIRWDNTNYKTGCAACQPNQW